MWPLKHAPQARGSIECTALGSFNPCRCWEPVAIITMKPIAKSVQWSRGEGHTRCKLRKHLVEGDRLRDGVKPKSSPDSEHFADAAKDSASKPSRAESCQGPSFARVAAGRTPLHWCHWPLKGTSCVLSQECISFWNFSLMIAWAFQKRTKLCICVHDGPHKQQKFEHFTMPVDLS